MSGRKLFWPSAISVLFCCAIFTMVTGCSSGGSASVGVTVSASANTVDGGNGITLTASVSNDKNAAGVSWNLTGAGALSNQSASGATYTAPAASSSSQTATITATSMSDTSKTGNVTITIPAKPTVTTTSTNLTGTVGTPLSIQLQGSGGIAPYKSWAVSSSGSALPSCLTLSTAGVLTTASGTAPTAACAGTYSNLIFTFADSGTPNALTATSGALTLTIAAAPAITFGGAPTPTSTLNVAYSSAVSATGGVGALTYSKATGNLPTGLALASNGAITGTPAAGSAGSWTFAVTASDAFGDAATSGNYTIVVGYPQLAVTTTSLATGNGSSAYSQTLGASGGSGTGYTWTVTSGASSLTALNLTLSSAGVISGTPPAAGTATFTAQVKDSASSTATQALVVTIYNALSLPTPNPVSLPSTGYVGAPYSGTITGSGGSGNLAISVASGLPADSLTGTSAGAALTVAGTPTTATTVTFGAKLTDTTTGNFITQTGYTVTVSAPTAVTLPTPNPGSLPAATAGQSYSGTITASGGVAPYTWTINGTTVGSGGLSLGNGTLSASSTGGTTLTVAGTPSTSGSVTLTNVKVTDSLSSNASNTYAITVNSAGQKVSGQISLAACGTSGNEPPFTVSINYPSAGSPTTTTTDASGNYSFSNIPSGSYTVTPSISGASSFFYPATQSVTITSSDVTGKNFQASVGYSVSGTVSYSGSKTGRVYVRLTSNCGGSLNQPGTSIAAPGAFTIQGVPPGTYTLAATMDTQGFGAANQNAPSGATTNVAVANANATGASITMNDASAVALTTGPAINVISPADQSVAIAYQPIENGNSVEMATSYTVQWSTSSTFASITGSKTFSASGDNTDVWVVTGLTNAQTYYFRAQGTAGSSNSAWTVYGGGTPTAITIGAPTSGSTITGTVTFPGTATGPLFVGFYSQTAGIYIATIQNPVSPQAFTVHVPNGSGYFQFGIVDQNNNGIVDSGDISNTDQSGNGSNTVAIAGNATMNLTLLGTSSDAVTATTFLKQTSASTTSTVYRLNFNIREANKLPVAVQLTSGPNILHPVDIEACSNCGRPQFNYNQGLFGATPNVGDAYVFHVTYADSSTEDLTANVTGWNSSASVVNASNLVTNQLPAVSGTTTPTFTWTDPANASSFVYQFFLNDNSGNTIWAVPGQNSNLTGFSSSITSIVWGTDPSGSGSTPTVGSLTHTATYHWNLNVIDSNGNQAASQTYFIP